LFGARAAADGEEPVVGGGVGELPLGQMKRSMKVAEAPMSGIGGLGS